MQEEIKEERRPAPVRSFRSRYFASASGVARAAALVSAGSMTLVVMATLVKHLGTELPAMEILFFRS